MSTQVLMPQMGESIAEGTIVRWIKKVGDAVDRDEPLFEISTDKVDAEIPSPAAGVLAEIKVKEGETVAVNSVVATIGEPGAAAANAGNREPAAAAPAPQADGSPSPASSPASIEPPAPAAKGGPGPVAAPAAGAEASTDGHGVLSKDEQRRARSSPLVRKIAKEHGIDIRALHGSGIGGRVTKHDILDYIEHGPPAAAEPAAPEALAGAHVPAFMPGESVEIAPMTVMRKKIAEHMVVSRRTSAHVHSVFEVNFSRVAQLRDQKKGEYEHAGVKLTYMSFITKAVVDALRAVPVLNASIDGDKIVYKKDINIGIAVALDWGLVVPVLKHADEKNLLGLSRAIADLASRARAKGLKPEEVQGGTFTITNPGNFGAQFGLPIINQPQVGILGVGAIEKRAVVIDDAIAIRPMGYLTLGFDHRLVDGAVADQFMAH
ncbi:MAG TPA: dihydrolipoamide acetyltransferase family protein, partial [Vicinamibacterales bacterium]|nr:dihydrolipoamide acetyltransferase family protein [Vicinamibacterales bacterium]